MVMENANLVLVLVNIYNMDSVNHVQKVVRLVMLVECAINANQMITAILL